ncbi:helix-turn-helix transcriptional regulator [Sphingomonas sp.]|uniref:helix-turn-helix domain-containing protein n=1 Tax=Sphingomonas sp. TaxID=28214 RepID=UPI001B22727A|nr:helix-turn-helix transcriptional regulator [Sphingomonas sp.]MBO9711330.1 helix-turn-helix domain-containing protein [Sphingomonas sp.]
MPYSSAALAEESVLPFAPHELAPFDTRRLPLALRSARTARRLSLADIAAETRIGMRFLEAIEAARFGEFRSAIHAVGFARAFARAVGVDEQWAARAMREEIALCQAKPAR